MCGIWRARKVFDVLRALKRPTAQRSFSRECYSCSRPEVDTATLDLLKAAQVSYLPLLKAIPTTEDREKESAYSDASVVGSTPSISVSLITVRECKDSESELRSESARFTPRCGGLGTDDAARFEFGQPSPRRYPNQLFRA